MNNIPKSQPDQIQPKKRHQTFRILADVPDVGWKLIGGMRASMMPTKRLSLPERASKTVQVALVNLSIEGNKPVVMNYLMIEKWQFDSDGFADKENQLKHNLNRVLTLFRGGESVFTRDSHGKAVVSQEVVDAIKHCLK